MSVSNIMYNVLFLNVEERYVDRFFQYSTKSNLKDDQGYSHMMRPLLKGSLQHLPDLNQPCTERKLNFSNIIYNVFEILKSVILPNILIVSAFWYQLTCFKLYTFFMKHRAILTLKIPEDANIFSNYICNKRFGFFLLKFIVQI